MNEQEIAALATTKHSAAILKPVETSPPIWRQADCPAIGGRNFH
jgi:hypothetical protein